MIILFDVIDVNGESDASYRPVDSPVFFVAVVLFPLHAATPPVGGYANRHPPLFISSVELQLETCS